MDTILIAAMSRNGVIGNAGKIPWRCKEDMKWFKDVTMGNTIILGRKTWESLPKAKLPGRQIIVLSKDMNYETGNIVKHTMEEALECATSIGKDVFIAGGAEIYKLGFPYVNWVLLTTILADYDGDTYFPSSILEDLMNENKWWPRSHWLRHPDVMVTRFEHYE